MFVTGASDLLPLPPVVGKNDANKNQASKQATESSPPVRTDTSLTYFSPVVRIDPETQQTIIIFREADGEVKKQYPSEEELEAYRKEQFEEVTALPSAPSQAKSSQSDGGQQVSEPAPAVTAEPKTPDAPKPAAPKPADDGSTGSDFTA